MGTKKTILMVVAAGLFLSREAGAELLKAKNPERVEITANRMRWTKVTGGDYDDRTQKVQIEVIARNLDYNHPATGLTLHYWVLAESLVNKRSLLVIDSGTMPVTLTSTPEGREIRQKGELITLKWDDTEAVFGERYKGYILVLLNVQNEVVAVAANQSLWESNFQKAFALKKGAWCMMDLKPGKAP